MTRLVIATNNKNKLREIREMLADTDISVISQQEAGVDADVEETGTTFAENAELKAAAVWDAMQAKGEACWVLADDSGLSVDALDGAPGVYSHRFAGENATDADRIAKLLSLMADVPDEKRGAHFACVMCLIAPDGKRRFFEGKAEGVILRAPQGENGFGYDPVFGFGTGSFAELSAAEKNAVSHRYHALRQVGAFFDQQD